MLKKILEKAIYSLGVSFSFYNLNLEIDYLEKNLPEEYKNRNVIDIGCGDGKTSIKLKKVLSPKTFTGVDTSKALIKNAQKHNINARIIKPKQEKLSGDIGVLWGVIHHLDNPESTLKEINENFKSLIIRESIDDKRIFELGQKFNKERLLSILKEAGIKPAKIINIKENKSVIIIS